MSTPHAALYPAGTECFVPGGPCVRQRRHLYIVSAAVDGLKEGRRVRTVQRVVRGGGVLGLLGDLVGDAWVR